MNRPYSEPKVVERGIAVVDVTVEAVSGMVDAVDDSAVDWEVSNVVDVEEEDAIALEESCDNSC